MPQTKILDHGYVELVESWGSDERIIESARMSTGKGFQGWGPMPCHGCQDSPVVGSVWQKLTIDDGMGTEIECPVCKGKGELQGDEKLLRFLWEHKHATPFEMAGMTIEVQAPIFVFREWHRHRTQSYNEMSGRYTVLPALYYTPSIERLMSSKQDTKNKQGSADGFTQSDAEAFQSFFQAHYADTRLMYEDLIRQGVSKEVARLVLPVAQYSKMRASANLRNWLAFLTLRLDPAAQFEIREYATAVGGIIKELYPRTWALFKE